MSHIEKEALLLYKQLSEDYFAELLQEHFQALNIDIADIDISIQQVSIKSYLPVKQEYLDLKIDSENKINVNDNSKTNGSNKQIMQ